jgi:phosphatidate cytidylyltransferase
VTAERLWGWQHGFDHIATVWLTAGVAAALLAASAAILALGQAGLVAAGLRRELWLRTRSWAVMVPLLVVPVLLGALWTMGFVALLGIACYAEYARATGLFREKLVHACVFVGILVLTFATVDHWYGFFAALVPLTVGVIAVVSIPLDRPEGYIQRVGLAVFGYLLFGCALGHLGYMANDWNYRPILLLVFAAVGLSDVAAFVIGRSLGGPKLLPRTSPNKTVSGAVGSLVVTALFVLAIAGPIFAGTGLASPWRRLGLGVIISLAAQLGDLMLSSIKRDLNIKDTGALIPGHGGVLDRCNSLLLTAPAVFHYIGYFVGFGLDQPTRIITGPA